MEKSESRKALIDMFQKMDEMDAKERINERVNALHAELKEIAERAYQAAIGDVVAEYQERLNDEGLTKQEREELEQERKCFEADPSTRGITIEKVPIIDEADNKRALQIAEILKKIEATGDLESEMDMNGEEFVRYMRDFGERQKTT